MWSVNRSRAIVVYHWIEACRAGSFDHLLQHRGEALGLEEPEPIKPVASQHPLKTIIPPSGPSKSQKSSVSTHPEVRHGGDKVEHTRGTKSWDDKNRRTVD